MINILLCKRKIFKTVSEKCCKYAHEKGADQMVEAADSKSTGSEYRERSSLSLVTFRKMHYRFGKKATCAH